MALSENDNTAKPPKKGARSALTDITNKSDGKVETNLKLTQQPFSPTRTNSSPIEFKIASLLSQAPRPISPSDITGPPKEEIVSITPNGTGGGGSSINSNSNEDKFEEDHTLMTDREDDFGHPHSQGILTWHDPLNQYTETIYAELRQNELTYKPRADYMENVQKDINHTMRGILVDWLVEVGEEYKLCPQTLFLTVRYIDRLLSAVSVHRTKLQLVGITCMLLASKYEEIYPPSVDDFVYISDNTYSRDEVLRMETVLLNSLKFSLTNSTCWEFARRFSAACGLDKRTTALVNYIIESFLQEPLYLKIFAKSSGCSFSFSCTFYNSSKTMAQDFGTCFSICRVRY